MSDSVTEVPAQPGPTTVANASQRARASADKAAAKAAGLASDAKERLGDLSEAAGTALNEAGVAIGEAADKAGDAIAEATTHAMTRLRNNAELPSERGATSIANEVVEKVAGIAAREVPGVFDLGGDTARVFSAIRERLHIGDESKAQGVSVRLAGRQAEVSVTLVLEYGFVVSSVTDKVREKVISSVEALLELDVTAVNILVDDIHVENDGPVGDDVARAAGYSTSTAGVVVGTAPAAE